MKNNPAQNLFLFLFVIVTSIGALTYFNYQFSVSNPGGNDFLARWMGASMWLKEGLSPYDERVSLETQEWIYGHPADPEIGEDKNHFVYPMYSMIFFGPFGLLDYTLARAIWMTLLEVSAIASVFVSLKLVDWRPPLWLTTLIIFFAVFWYHGARTVIIGQFAGLNALLIVMALNSIKEDQLASAGILLALSTSKPQMVHLLIPFTLIWAISTRRLKLVISFSITLLALLGLSLYLVPEWLLRMIGQMLEYPTYTFIGSPLSIIAAAVPGLESQLNVVFQVLAYLVLVIYWFLAWKKDARWFIWTALMTIVITNLTAFRTATTNYVMLLPVLILVFRIWEQRWKTTGRVIILLTVFSLFGGLWWLFLTTVEGNVESAVMYLPLPLLSFILLWWARWWAVRPQKLLLEELSEQMR